MSNQDLREAYEAIVIMRVANGGDYPDGCQGCGVYPDDFDNLGWEELDHKPDCIVLKARAWLAANPVGEEPKESEIETLRRALSASEEYREAYRKGKFELFAMGGEILSAAMKALPCSEGPLERASDRLTEGTYEGWVRKLIRRCGLLLSFRSDPVFWESSPGGVAGQTNEILDRIEAMLKTPFAEDAPLSPQEINKIIEGLEPGDKVGPFTVSSNFMHHAKPSVFFRASIQTNAIGLRPDDVAALIQAFGGITKKEGG